MTATYTRKEALARFFADYVTARSLLAEGKMLRIGNSFDGREITTEEQFHRWFIGCLHAKINRRGGLSDARSKWRKWGQDYFWRCYRDQQRIRGRLIQRVVVTSFETKEARRRYTHLLTYPQELM